LSSRIFIFNLRYSVIGAAQTRDSSELKTIRKFFILNVFKSFTVKHRSGFVSLAQTFSFAELSKNVSIELVRFSYFEPLQTVVI